MSKSMNSPTARLLQTSRLFSLPRPLPQPALENITSTGVYRSSDSATLPYPTSQAIVTPASSHHRGDWGLKRALPTKATRHTSTPTIRVSALDNGAHITDFGSAADHVQTEVKWREMAIPLVKKERRTHYSGRNNPIQSVYDDNLDNTDMEAVKLGSMPADQGYARRTGGVLAQSTQVKRWKFSGPWVTGMSEGEFELYMLRQIVGRKAEFRDFLVERILERRVREEERVLRDQGERKTTSRYRREELRQEILENYETEEKKLRDEHANQHLGSELTAAICEFLDLPGIQSVDSGIRVSSSNYALQNTLANVASDSASPPSTHPGAGLSHVRSNAFMENHPLWGPQAYRSPVLSRVLRPRNSITGVEINAKVGVGGVVTTDPVGGSYQGAESRSRNKDLPSRERWRDAQDMTHTIDEDLEGGNKIWVHPEAASIDEQGRIRLEVSRGDKEAIAVKENEVELIHEARRTTMRGPDPVAPPGTAGNANFGTRLPDFGRPAPNRGFRSRMQGFDKELGRSPQQGEMKEGDAAAKIRELLGDSGGMSPRR